MVFAVADESLNSNSSRKPIFDYPASCRNMPPTSLEQIILELRDAIGPVILISGGGLLLFTKFVR